MAFATTREKNEGLRVVTEALQAIEEKIKEKKGTFVLKEAVSRRYRIYYNVYVAKSCR